MIAQLKNEELSEDHHSEDDYAEELVSSEVHFNYTTQDVILYALSGDLSCLSCSPLTVLFAVGVSTSEASHLNFLYEANDDFAVLPTFACTVALNAVYDKSIFQEAISRYNLEDNIIRVRIYF